jgi:hypothetical protein
MVQPSTGRYQEERNKLARNKEKNGHRKKEEIGVSIHRSI